MLSLFWGVPAFASDGVIEINQASAVHGDVSSGDTAGFPVTIGTSGSYILTGNLATILDEAAILISADDVTLDLNGFTVAGGGSCSGLGTAVSCTASSGTGIASAGDRITVKNGTVRGFGSHGISLNDYCHIVDVTAMHNGADGIDVDRHCVIRDSIAAINGGQGITTGAASSLTNLVARSNGGDGIETDNGSTVQGCSSWDNGGDGFDIGFSATVIGNVAYDNEGDGFDVRGGALVKSNTGYANNGFDLRAEFGTAYMDNVFRGLGDGYVTGNGFDAGRNVCWGQLCP
jgi:hypothetical protein